MATNATIFVFIESDGVIVIFSAGQQMSSAVAFQTNGFGFSFQCSAHVVIASVRSATLVKMPRRNRLSVSSLNHRSTRFSQELDVGVG